MPAVTQLVGVDWGTSNCRAFLLSKSGQILSKISDNQGIAVMKDGNFEQVLDQLCGPWLASYPESGVLLSGMVGSRQGWIEAPYCPCPCDLTTLRDHAIPLPADRWRGFIIPGLSSTGLAGAPDVMRGEETQVAGLAMLQPNLTGTVCLPGSHSKWVSLRPNRIDGFSTFFTGETYSALRHHTLLARLMTDDTISPSAFKFGVEQSAAPGGLMHQLFSVRTRGLTGELQSGDLASYLSGLLIGSELRAVEEQGYLNHVVHLIGENDVAQRYHDALHLLGAQIQVWPAEQVTAAGLWLLGQQLGLCKDR